MCIGMLSGGNNKPLKTPTASLWSHLHISRLRTAYRASKAFSRLILIYRLSM
ncbi:hypothetical protein [Microviridae sp.]|nr:hypothetical protein [Microviridae sp.]